MARSRTLFAAALNIRLHPHSEDRYTSLLHDAFSLRTAVQVRGDQHLMLSSVSKKEYPITGTIARYTEIDPSLPWFNSQKFDVADEEDRRMIQIPPDLKPNYTPFFFAFYPDVHLFTFEQRSKKDALSPLIAKIFIEKLLNSAEVQGKYGYVSVDVLAAKEMLAQILSISQLRHLTITVQRPNPDDLGGYDADVERRLDRQNAKRVRINYDALPGKSLVPDDETKVLAGVAMENGEIKAIGTEGGKKIIRSNIDHPKIESVKYDPDLKTDNQAFMEASDNLAKSRKRRVEN